MKPAYCIAGVMAFAAVSPVHAQSYPIKSVRLIVPLAPGGGNDTIARLIAQKISPLLGQQVQDRLHGEAVTPVGNSPDEFAAHIRAEYERMARVIREAHIVLE